MSKKELDRRQFLRGSVYTVSAAALAACAKAEDVQVEPTEAVEPTVAPTDKPKPTPTNLPTPAPTEVVSMYHEAPMLKDMVDAGELPMVEDRLPMQPIVKSVREVGSYGGKLVGLVPDPDTSYVTCGGQLGHALTRFNEEYAIIPDVAESLDLSDDMTVLTVKLRQGVKWSDGVALTTDDVKFWYEDIIMNEELTPTYPTAYTVNGELCGLEIVDDYTFKFIFSGPYPTIMEYSQAMGPWAPRHYMEEYHIAYNENADVVARQNNYEFWWEYFLYLNGGYPGCKEASVPQIAGWVMESVDMQGNMTFVRNPYFWWVDQDGNQLPYTDRFSRIVVENQEVIAARSMSGETTHATWFLALADYPLYKQNELSGDYTIELYPDARASEWGLAFNYSHKDPVIRELFNTKEFRIACSHAWNREEIKEIIFLGQGKSRQPIVDPTCSFYKEGIDEYYIDYDVDKANQLLDDLGLEWDANHEVRLLPDGRPIQLTLGYFLQRPNFAEIAEMVKVYWKEIGIELALKQFEHTAYKEYLASNDADMGCWAIGGASEIYARTAEPIRWRPPFHWSSTPLGGIEYWNWYASNGEQGMEPPEILKEQYQMVDEWLMEPRGSEKYMELGEEILTRLAENCWLIGTVGLVPRPVLLHDTLHNGPELGKVVTIEYSVWRPFMPEAWWLDEGPFKS